MPLSGGTTGGGATTVTVTGSKIIGSHDEFNVRAGNLITDTASGNKYLKTGTFSLASNFPNLPAANQITYGGALANQLLAGASTPNLAVAGRQVVRTDGAQRVFNALYNTANTPIMLSANGGQTFTAGPTLAYGILDCAWHAPATGWFVTTTNGIYNLPDGGSSWTQVQSGSYVGIGSNGTYLLATTPNNASGMLSSANGTSWGGVSSGTAAYYNVPRWLNGVWYVLCGSTASGTSTGVSYCTATNPGTFTAGATITSGVYMDLLYLNSTFVAFAYGASVLRTTANAQTTAFTATSSFTYNGTAITIGGVTYLSGNYYFAYTTTGSASVVGTPSLTTTACSAVASYNANTDLAYGLALSSTGLVVIGGLQNYFGVPAGTYADAGPLTLFAAATGGYAAGANLPSLIAKYMRVN